MMPAAFLARVVDPGLALLAELGGPPVTLEARVMLMAIAGQESAWAKRRQVTNDGSPGPARGYYQFEGGPYSSTAQVMTHPRAMPLMAKVCQALDIPFDRPLVHAALEFNDLVATAAARCNLLPDPSPLARANDPDLGWTIYLRVWKPGKPFPEKWPHLWRTAVQTIG